jgi:ABC-type transporter lipoprotein component MlaA
VNGASARIGEYESFKKATLDPYVAMRSAYFESRAQAVQESKAKPDTGRSVAISIPEDDFRGSEPHPSTEGARSSR